MADRDRVHERRIGPLRPGSVILHVDMDSFFVSIERALDPRLLGRPVLVGGDPAGRGVVVACSYEARPAGVKSGMPIRRALALCPDAVLLPSRIRFYTQISVGILRLLCRFSERVEPASVDEAYLDLTGEAGEWEGAARVARKIRAAVRAEYGVSASVGCGPTKMVAKIASRLAKPDGQKVIPPEEVAGTVYPLAVTAVGGVGEKTAAELRLLGIRTIGDLAAADEAILHRRFGKSGSSLSRIVRGEEPLPVVPFRETPDPKSMSNERTFARDADDPETIDAALLFLSEMLARRLRKEGLAGNVFHIKLRFPDFRTLVRSRTLPEPTNDERTILLLAREGTARHAEGRALRLVGIGLSGLTRVSSGEDELDLEPFRARYRGSLPVFDAVRDRFGEAILRKARLL